MYHVENCHEAIVSLEVFHEARAHLNTPILQPWDYETILSGGLPAWYTLIRRVRYGRL